MSKRLKTFIIDLIISKDIEQAIKGLDDIPSKKLINQLLSIICIKNDIVRWKGISIIGRIVSKIAKNDIESSRIIIRRFMWSLNDESGGIGWGLPEAIAEILANDKTLAQEYTHILVSYIREDGNFLEFEPLIKGAVWGIGRLAQKEPELLKSFKAENHLIKLLGSNSIEIKGLVAWSLGTLKTKDKKAIFGLGKLLKNNSVIEIYTNLAIKTFYIKELAIKALYNINK